MKVCKNLSKCFVRYLILTDKDPCKIKSVVLYFFNCLGFYIGEIRRVVVEEC